MKAVTNMNGEFLRKLLKLVAVALCALALVPSAKAVNSLDNEVIFDFENQTSPPTVFDLSATPDNGTFNGTAAFTIAQAHSGTGSASFPGGPLNHIEVANTINFSGNFSISMWIRPSTLPSSGLENPLFSKGLNGQAGNFRLELYNPGSGTIFYYTHPGGTSMNGVTPIVVDVWQQLSIIRTNDYVQMFVNGVSQGAPFLDTPIVSLNASSYFGRGGFSGDPGYYGFMDDVSIVPEPSTVVLMSVPTILIGLRALRRRHAAS